MCCQEPKTALHFASQDRAQKKQVPLARRRHHQRGSPIHVSLREPLEVAIDNVRARSALIQQMNGEQILTRFTGTGRGFACLTGSGLAGSAAS